MAKLTETEKQFDLVQWAYSVPHVCAVCGETGSLFSALDKLRLLEGASRSLAAPPRLLQLQLVPNELRVWDCHFETCNPPCRHVVCAEHVEDIREGRILLHGGN